MSVALLLLVALCIQHVSSTIVSCNPQIRFTYPALGATVPTNATSRYTRLRIEFKVTSSNRQDCPAETGDNLYVEMFERHSVNPGHIVLGTSEPIFIVLTEPGTYIFEMNLMQGPYGAGVLLSSDYTVFDIVGNYAKDIKPTIREAFNNAASLYTYNGIAITDSIKLSTSHLDQVFVPQWGAGSPPPAPSSYAAETGSTYFDRLPQAWKPLIVATRAVIVGGVSPPFDGTKQFMVQYETTVDRRLINFTHLDMMSAPIQGSQELMSQMLQAAGIPIKFHQMVVERVDFGNGDSFFAGGATLARARNWCDIALRYRTPLQSLAEFMEGFDVLWRINHEPMEEYLQQVPRLVNPSIVRINDLVGRIDMPCRFGRAKPPRPQRGNIIDLAAAQLWNDTKSTCWEDAAEFQSAAVDWRPWMPAIDLYGRVRYNQEMQKLHQPWSTRRSTGGAPGALYVRSIQKENNLAAAYRSLDPISFPPVQSLSDALVVGGQFEPMSYEMLAAPSHFVAQHTLTASYMVNAMVVPGLNSRKVRVLGRNSKGSQAACGLLLGKQSLRQTPLNSTVVIAFIGRVVREKGIGIFLKAAARMHLPAEVRIVIIGGASDQRYGELVERYARALGISQRVRFTGFVNPTNLTTWYRHSCIDLVVAPYLRPMSESFGLVLIEAMEAAVPVVHFGVGGIQDYSRNHTNSIMAGCSHESCLANAMQSLVNNATKRLEMGANAAAFIKSYIQKAATAELIETKLRAEHVASTLTNGHILHTTPYDCEASSFHANKHTAPASWWELHSSLSDGDATKACGALGTPIDFTSPTNLQLQAERLSSTTIRLTLQLVVSASGAQSISTGISMSQALVPGYPDVLCAAQTNDTVPCSIADVQGAAVALVSQRVRQSASLCWRGNAGDACSYLMDLIDPEQGQPPMSTEETFPVTWPVLSMRVRADSNRSLFAIVDSRTPNLVLAAAAC